MVKGISTDPIADMLTIIRNGYKTAKDEVRMPLSKARKSVAEILSSEGYIGDAAVVDEELVIKLRYIGKTPALTEIKRVSKPGLRVYAGFSELPSFVKGLGIVIISTSKGVMTSRQAQKQKLGGELICRVW